MDNLIEVKGLTKYFYIKKGLLGKMVVRAVDGVDINIRKGETLGLVGESGCGKSTLGRAILLLIPLTQGDVIFEGKSLIRMKKQELRMMRKYMQIVFQDPYSSLNPRMRIKDLLSEPFIAFNEKVEDERLKEVMKAVGLSEEHLDRYPHEFSGGQRQRINIARAIIMKPKFVVLDEPTSALDVSIQAQILNLLKDFQKELNLTYLFITHNINVVSYMSDRVAIMYAGKIIEIVNTEELIMEPMHPYTKALMASVPIPNPDLKRPRTGIGGEPPSLINPPTGCRFHPRCPYAMEICKKEIPNLLEVKKEHYVSCFLYSS
ncbi:MAG: ABC transporter ATP-binding protein [Candidatus Methanomethylicaceae archaeon]